MRRRRKAFGLTQAAFAAIVAEGGIYFDAREVCKYELGTKTITPRIAECIARAFRELERRGCIEQKAPPGPTVVEYDVEKRIAHRFDATRRRAATRARPWLCRDRLAFMRRFLDADPTDPSPTDRRAARALRCLIDRERRLLVRWPFEARDDLAALIEDFRAAVDRVELIARIG